MRKKRREVRKIRDFVRFSSTAHYPKSNSKPVFPRTSTRPWPLASTLPYDRCWREMGEEERRWKRVEGQGVRRRESRRISPSLIRHDECRLFAVWQSHSFTVECSEEGRNKTRLFSPVTASTSALPAGACLKWDRRAGEGEVSSMAVCHDKVDQTGVKEGQRSEQRCQFITPSRTTVHPKQF